MDDALLNEGLDLALEWGANWLKPINERLAERHPAMSAEELEAANKACQQAMYAGFDQVVASLRAANRSEAIARGDYERAMRARFAWISQANLGRVFSQGCYYAWKDGEL